MMVRGLAILAMGALVMAGADARRNSDAGTSAGSVLRLGSGSRGPALGDAYTADAKGVASMHYNPAGLGATTRAEVGASYQALVLDVVQGELGFTHPINSQSAWGVSATYLDYGKTQRVTVADVINGIQPATSFTGRDFVIGASYGRMLTDIVHVGATAKVINEEIDNTSATAIAGDIGITIRPTNLPIRIGVSGQNFGTSLKFDRVSEDLPALVRGGLAFDLFNDKVTVMADIEKVRDQDVDGGVGVEFRMMDMLAFRVGWDSRIDVDEGVTAGLGIRFSDLMLDYAYLPYGKLGNNHRLSLQYQFGPDYRR